MKRSIVVPGGDLQFAILGALWELGEATAPEIHARVGEPRGLVYTTTAKVLDRLYAKGLLSRERQGKAFAYRARIGREKLELARARDALRRVLGDEPGPAIATLVDAVESIDPKLLDELASVVTARRRHRRGS